MRSKQHAPAVCFTYCLCELGFVQQLGLVQHNVLLAPLAQALEAMRYATAGRQPLHKDVVQKVPPLVRVALCDPLQWSVAPQSQPALQVGDAGVLLMRELDSNLLAVFVSVTMLLQAAAAVAAVGGWCSTSGSLSTASSSARPSTLLSLWVTVTCKSSGPTMQDSGRKDTLWGEPVSARAVGVVLAMRRSKAARRASGDRSMKGCCRSSQ